jgi:hypothetical protein
MSAIFLMRYANTVSPLNIQALMQSLPTQPLFLLDRESQLSEHLNGTGLPTLEIARG